MTVSVTDSNSLIWLDFTFVNRHMFRMVPGRRQQVRLYIEICRVPAGGQPEQQTNWGVTGCPFALRGKQTGNGWRPHVWGEITCYGLLCQAAFIYHAQKKDRQVYLTAVLIKTWSAVSAVRRNSPWRHCERTRAFTALYLVNTLPQTAGISSAARMFGTFTSAERDALYELPISHLWGAVIKQPDTCTEHRLPGQHAYFTTHYIFITRFAWHFHQWRFET